MMDVRVRPIAFETAPLDVPSGQSLSITAPPRMMTTPATAQIHLLMPLRAGGSGGAAAQAQVGTGADAGG